MTHVNFQVKKRTKGPKAEQKMIIAFQKLSQQFIREILERSYYRKKSELKQLKIRQKKRKIKKWKNLEAESMFG